jgi:NosR/NirI family transcriptional regulator, nitrous oxide reductase regulator
MHMRCLSFLAAALMWFVSPSFAGTVDRDTLSKMFPAPMTIGEQDAAFPVWPLFNGGGGEANLAGWIFETSDFAPIPGFSGTPPNMLIALAPDGTFLDARVLSHHEPVFLDGLGPEPLAKFMEQYRGKELGKPIKVGSNINSGEKAGSAAQYIDGVSKATASVLIINQSVIASAVKVARAKLGFAGSSASANPAKPRTDNYRSMSWKELLAEGLVSPVTFSNEGVEKEFAGTAVEQQDEAGLAKPKEAFVDMFIADPLVPSVGRALLGDKPYEKLLSDLPDGQPAILIMSAGRWSPQGENWTPGSVPDRIAVRQAGLPIVVRDMAYSRQMLLPEAAAMEAMILKIPATAGFDPASAFDVVPHITRAKGQIYPELFSVDLAKPVQWPQDNYVRSEAEESGDGALSVWKARKADLIIVIAALAALTLGLANQKRLTAKPAVFKAGRMAFLVFTLGFIGWYAQAQLSIVTLIGAARAAATTHDFAFLLWDPPSLVLWVFTLVTFVVWGRGVFCGWLCPFGALQELAAEVSLTLKIKQWRVPHALDVHLRKLKYATLAVIIFAALKVPGLADTAAEVEPFKTSITLMFARHWPFVAYALGLIAMNLFVYKAFCRYLCPLGAAMAIGGKLRILDWIPRRAECGSPCQLCKVQCRYGAIEKSGKIDYDECFQCLDCVAIYFDPKACVPLIQAEKRERRMPEKVAA